jgi:hypothetical protein
LKLIIRMAGVAMAHLANEIKGFEEFNEFKEFN